MNTFDYAGVLSAALNPETIRLLGAVHEYKGRQDLYRETQPEALDRLCETARIQSTGASNRIENIQTSEARLSALMEQRAQPRTRDEHEIVGYRYVLDLIHSSYEDIPVTSGVILQLHRDLYRGLDVSFAGRWKDADNIIAERLPGGAMAIRFKPTSAVATPGAVESLCEQYRLCERAGSYDMLLVSLLFAFDFVSIHPFNDGNGRMSRLLTLLLLYKAGYLVGRYISIEREIERTKESYYEALRASSDGWELGENDYAPFVNYMLGVIITCCQELDRRLSPSALSCGYEESVRRFFGSYPGAASKREVMEAAPGMSRATAERILQKLQREGFIEKVGSARATKYRFKL